MAQQFRRQVPMDPDLGVSAPVAPPHNQYSEEAARAAQRYHEQVTEIEKLNTLANEWKAKCFALEKDNDRLQRLLAESEATVSRTAKELGSERDSYKYRLMSLVSQFESAGAIILKCMDAARNEAPVQVDLKSMAAVVEDHPNREATPEDVKVLTRENPGEPSIPAFLRRSPDETSGLD